MGDNQTAAPFDKVDELHIHKKVTLLVLAYDDRAPGQPSALDVLNHLYMTSSPVLYKVHMLTLELDSPSQDDLRKVYAALQHIHQ
ncbi:hypothetical protein OEZ85_003289 [Tetradesmus obliquus]|uniref:Uncharacterized protein n=1 Tax=Tetradesmus obliquus TaxID=3088 RepID=A0ABY8U498_TETOB|nr:hypothetical protein OEZ85_003289 [Tetradesmus obliquus]